MSEYKARVTEASRKLSTQERIRIKDTSASVSIDRELLSVEAAGSKYLAVEIDCYAKVDIHNERSENTDYSVYCFLSKDGQIYSTSSESAFKAVLEMQAEIEEDGETLSDYTVGFYHKPSKNFGGKNFITATLI